MEVFGEEAKDSLCLTALKKLQLFRLPTVDIVGSACLPELILHVNKVTSLQVKVYCDIQSLEFYILHFLRSGKRKDCSGSLTTYTVVQNHFNSIVVGLSIQLAKGNTFTVIVSLSNQDS